MANTAHQHNVAVIGRRLDDLFALDAVQAQSWHAVLGQLRDAGMLDDRRALMLIGGIVAAIMVTEDALATA